MACSQPDMEDSRDFIKPEEYRLYVTNLPVELNEEGIKQIFDHYGKIIGLFYRPNATWTFVTYRTYREAEYALRDLHNKPPLYLKVSFGKEKTKGEIREEKSQDEKSTGLYEQLIPSSPYNSKPRIQAINNGKHMNALYKERLESLVPAPKYTSDDLLYPVLTDPYTYDPYESAEPYNSGNALWTRGTITVSRDGKRHVSHGRGYTSYEIPDPHPRIETLINQIHEKRFNGLYEHGQDVLKHKIGKCRRCNKPANMKCERCHSFYCSKECQLLDWPYHKIECRKMPALIKDTGSLSSSSNEENAPVSRLQKTQKTLRRPKQAASSLFRKNAEETSNKNTNVTNNEISKEEHFQTDHQTSDINKISNDISKLTTTEKDDRKKIGKINSSDALKIEENLSFQKDTFLPTSHFVCVKVVGIEGKGLYWVNKCRDKQAIISMISDLGDRASRMPKVKPIVGNLYAYKSVGLWHRVRVVSLNPTKVFFIDCGSTMTVTDNNFRQTNLEYLPPYANKISFSPSSEEFVGVIKMDDVINVKAVKYINDIIIVDVKPQQTGSAKSLNKSGSDSSIILTRPTVSLTTKDDNPKEKVFLSLPNVLDNLLENKNGFLDVQTVIYNNVYGVILIPDDIFQETQRVLQTLPKLCKDAKPIDKNKISIGQLVCGKRADGDWFRGYVVSLQPIRVAMIDETKVVSIEEVVTYPDELLNICKLGVICEVSTNNVKLKVGRSYIFKVICCTNEIRIKIIADNNDKIEAILKIWEPIPEQIGIKLNELKSGSEVCISAYHSPSKLYVRSLQIDDVEKFHKIMQDVAKCAQSAPHFKEPPVIGEMVLAQYTDDNFYRAIVTKVQQDEIRISYVDYGNGENTDLKKLKVLPADLKVHPSCATKVILKNVPTDATITKDLSDYFVCLTGREIPLICSFNGIPSEDGVFLTKANGESVNDKVKQLLTPSWEKDNEEDKAIYTVKDLEPAKLGGSDETRVIVLRTVKEGIKYVMCPLDIDLITNVYDFLPGLMNEYCKTADYYIPRYNELCLGLYDGNWYRALCIDNSTYTDKCQVFFLDYGNMEYVLHTDIRAMTKDFLTPATLSNICTIVNLAPIDEDGNISSRVLKRISELVTPDDNVLIKIVETEQEGFYKIELPEVKAQLVEEGLI